MRCFAARTKNLELLRESTSGGLFTELSRSAFLKSGIVFGVVWDYKTFTPIFSYAESEEELIKMRGAKYCASDMSNVFRQINYFLNQNRIVLFFGLPCQVAAIRKKFGLRDKLLLCGLFCHSTPERWIWEKIYK